MFLLQSGWMAGDYLSIGDKSKCNSGGSSSSGGSTNGGSSGSGSGSKSSGSQQSSSSGKMTNLSNFNDISKYE